MAETRKIAVIGAGTMGSGIALSYAMAGNDVIMYSRTEETLGKAKKVIDKSLELFIAESVLTEEQAEGSLRHLFYTTSLNEAAEGAWYVVETIAEKPDAKKELYEKLNGILDKETIIASNTSYLNIFELMPRGLLLGLVQRMDFNGLDIVANGLKNKAYVAAPAPGEDNAIFCHTEKGELGVKSGRGFYDYSGQAYEDVLHHRDEQLIRSVRLSDEFMKDPLQTK